MTFLTCALRPGWLVLLILLTTISSVSSLQSIFGKNNGNANAASSILKRAKSDNLQAAVLVPGFLTGADEFRDLCETLTKSGLPTVAVPMPNWHWIACLVRACLWACFTTVICSNTVSFEWSTEAVKCLFLTTIHSSLLLDNLAFLFL